MCSSAIRAIRAIGASLLFAECAAYASGEELGRERVLALRQCCRYVKTMESGECWRAFSACLRTFLAFPRGS